MKIRSLLQAGVLAVAGAAAMLVPSGVVMAGPCPADAPNPSASTLAECYIVPASGTPTDVMTAGRSIVNAVLGIIGIIAVVMVIYGGVSFITSQGDAAKVAKARNTLIYGAIGLIVTILAFSIVNFVIAQTTGTVTPAPTGP